MRTREVHLDKKQLADAGRSARRSPSNDSLRLLGDRALRRRPDGKPPRWWQRQDRKPSNTHSRRRSTKPPMCRCASPKQAYEAIAWMNAAEDLSENRIFAQNLISFRLPTPLQTGIYNLHGIARVCHRRIAESAATLAEAVTSRHSGPKLL